MNKILDENYYDLIINNRFLPDTNNAAITELNEKHSIFHVNVQNQTLCDLGTHPYYSFPTLYTLSSEPSLGSSNISPVQNNPQLAYFGLGVIIGIVDTGIDYSHPAFRFPDGTSRILSIWDQTIQDGSPPGGFTFGTEYTQEKLNLALGSGDPYSIVPSTDTNGHGTGIASIAAGSADIKHSFSGVVPEAQLAVVKLKEAKQNLKTIFCIPDSALCYQETDLILGIRYLTSLADRFGRPLVICIALSSSLSGHESLGATSSYINSLCQLPQINISVAAGNEGNNHRHHYSMKTEMPFSDEFELRISGADPFFSLEIWPDLQARLALEITAPNGETSPIIYPSFGMCLPHRFILNPTVAWINNILLEQENGTQLILIRFTDAVEGLWRIRVLNIDTNPFSYHSWLPNGSLISNGTFFLESSPDTTITAPGNADYALTASAYNHTNGSILISSSRGYTRFGHVKPTVAVPGYKLPCADLHSSYASLTGTGAAAAHAAGAVAIVFEWAVTRGNYTSITGNDVNTLIMRGASRTSGELYPNPVWGYGKLDLYNLFQLLTFV